nr:DUF5615 family PIN-like protein [Mucilaginibacter straminoryzae]
MLDMGISTKTITWLRHKGYDAIHLSDVGLHTLTDIEILRKAVEEDRIIITADMDFSQLLSVHTNYAASVIQFRVTNFKAENIIDKLQLIFQKLSSDFSVPQIVTVEDNRIRVRKLPF